MNRFIAVAVATLLGAVSAAQAQQAQAPSPAPSAAAPAATAPTTGKEPPPAVATKPIRTKKAFNGSFVALDPDKKTISFETDDGKPYTLPVVMPVSPEAQDRALALAAALHPGDKIVVFCNVDAREQPTSAFGLRMIGPTAPTAFR